MTHRFLVMGDNHGDVESLRRVLDDVGSERVDYVVHVGDFTSAWRTARRTDDEKRGKERGAEQLRAVEPVLEEFDALAEHGLVWVYGNQDYFGDLDHDLSVGTRLPDDGVVTVGDLRFTGSLDHVRPDVVLVTHMEHWRLADGFGGLAHFCGNSHRGRRKGRRLNSAFLQVRDPGTDRKRFGGYFVVEVGSPSGLGVDGPSGLGVDGPSGLGVDGPSGLVVDAPSGPDVQMRSIGDLVRVECERHAERWVQFQPESRGCVFCNEDGTLFREMCASGYYGLTHGTDRDTVTDEELIAYAEDLWERPPEGFREAFESYLADLDDHRYAPVTRADDGAIRLAEKSYSY